MRLTDEQLRTIQSVVARSVPQAFHYRLFLFGSRLNDLAKGGDVDLYLEVDSVDPVIQAQLKRRLRVELEESLDLPVDLIVQERQKPLKLVSEIARREGLPL
ncbi:MAG: nucleotidyltransferase domain-containing protein [Gammaproteobacteria bacterium]